jgi:protease-4
MAARIAKALFSGNFKKPNREKQMLKRLLLLSLFCCCLSTAFGQGIFSLLGGSTDEKKYSVKFLEGDREAKYEVLQIKIRGVIQEQTDEDEFPFKIQKDLMQQIKKDLELAENRDLVKVILLDIDSPGGEVTASDIIYHQIQKIKESTGKPVIAIIGSMGASGAYYIACAADKIIAHPTSILGSIGVLMQSINVKNLAEKIGIKAVYLKSEKTPNKDLLSPFREMSEKEKAMLMEILNGVYDRFVSIVSKSRGKTIKEIEKLADGGIYNSQKALQIGLIDKIGYKEDALEMACELADVETIALVKRYSKKSFSEILSEMTHMYPQLPSLNLELKKIFENAYVPRMMMQFTLPTD